MADLQRGIDVGAEDAGAEGSFTAAPGQAFVKQQLHLLGTAQVELVADHLLKELAAVQGPVEDFGAAHLELQDGELVHVAGALITSREGSG